MGDFVFSTGGIEVNGDVDTVIGSINVTTRIDHVLMGYEFGFDSSSDLPISCGISAISRDAASAEVVSSTRISGNLSDGLTGLQHELGLQIEVDAMGVQGSCGSFSRLELAN